MIKITRKGLTLAINECSIPAQGSSNVPVQFINDSESYQNYLIQPVIGFLTITGQFKAKICPYENGEFRVPVEAFRQSGMISIAIGLIDPSDTSHIEKTNQVLIRCEEAPTTIVTPPSGSTWVDVVTNLMDQYMETYIMPLLSSIVEEAENQQEEVKNLINEVDELVENVNKKIAKGEFIPKIEAVAVTTEGENASVEQSGTTKNPIFTFKIPKGQKGDTNTLTVGNVTSGDKPEVSIRGEAPNQIIDFVLQPGPKGDKGEKGDDGVVGSYKQNMMINSNFLDWINEKKQNNWCVDDGTLEDPQIATMWYRTPNMNTYMQNGARYFAPSQSVKHTDIASINYAFPSDYNNEFAGNDVTIACYVGSIAKKEDGTLFTWKMCMCGNPFQNGQTTKIFDDVNNIIEDKTIVLKEGLNILTIENFQYPSYNIISFAVYTEEIDDPNNIISPIFAKVNLGAYDSYIVNPHDVELAFCRNWYVKISNPAYSWSTSNDEFYIGVGEYKSGTLYCTIPVPSNMNSWRNMRIKHSGVAVRGNFSVLFDEAVMDNGINNGILALGFIKTSGNLNADQHYLLMLKKEGYIEIEKDVFSS